MPIDDAWAPDRDPRSDVRWQKIIKPDDQTVQDFANPKRDDNANAFGHMLVVPKREPKALPYTMTPVEDNPFTARNEAGPEDDEHPLVGLGRRFGAELDSTPGARARLHRLMHVEIRDQGLEPAQAFVETVRNRRFSPVRKYGHALDSMNDKKYYPSESIRGAEPDDDTRAMYDRAIDAAISGSNICAGATGNASGSVGFAGGPQTCSFGTGERFGLEGPDQEWMTSLLEGKGHLPVGPNAGLGGEEFDSGGKKVRLKRIAQPDAMPAGIPSNWPQPLGPQDVPALMGILGSKSVAQPQLPQIKIAGATPNQYDALVPKPLPGPVV